MYTRCKLSEISGYVHHMKSCGRAVTPSWRSYSILTEPPHYLKLVHTLLPAKELKDIDQNQTRTQT